MRTITILAVITITTTVLVYNFMREETASEQPQAVTSRTEATSSLDVQGRLDRLDKLASVLRRYQQTSQEQLQQAQSQQARVNNMLADLDARLRSVETAAGEQVTDTGVSDSDARKPESGEVSESDLGHWIDETLRVGYLDRDSTKLATDQAAKSLAKMPGVNLEDMQCGERFCRATFAYENGEQPDIRGLFGVPPFLNEGFTINEADGRVALYFARPGESLDEVRSEAREAAQLGPSW